ncbi:MAG: sulfur carrier protein [Candidatus Binatus sp.]|jgi:sulfur carrier protein|nr:sulfur carrier protein [Candidatus Binatus sp.]
MLNGDPFTIAGDSSLLALLAHLKMRPTRVAVEINHEIIPKAKFAETKIEPGDQIELINFVGGG